MLRRLFLSLAVLLSGLSLAHAGWSVGVSFVAPHCAPPPCRPHCHDYYYHRVRPLYVAPTPVYVQPVYQPVIAQPLQALPAPTPVSRSQSLLPPSRESDIAHYMQQLQSQDHRERVEAATQLGRLRVPHAVDPLVNCLTNDRSPAVREACARSLGQIGGSKSLDGLQQAAHADSDRQVRNSASLAADIIRAQYQR